MAPRDAINRRCIEKHESRNLERAQERDQPDYMKEPRAQIDHCRRYREREYWGPCKANGRKEALPDGSKREPRVSTKNGLMTTKELEVKEAS